MIDGLAEVDYDENLTDSALTARCSCCAGRLDAFNSIGRARVIDEDPLYRL
jgi:hypothetical protein